MRFQSDTDNATRKECAVVLENKMSRMNVDMPIISQNNNQNKDVHSSISASLASNKLSMSFKNKILLIWNTVTNPAAASSRTCQSFFGWRGIK